eukprot:2962954-Pleurochrysis_carterae.AAC.1
MTRCAVARHVSLVHRASSAPVLTTTVSSLSGDGTSTQPEASPPATPPTSPPATGLICRPCAPAAIHGEGMLKLKDSGACRETMETTKIKQW